MEFLIDHLLALRLTSCESMRASIDVQHEQFARQLSSMEKLLVLSHSKLSLNELHKNLKLVLKAGNKGMLKIVSIDSLIECIELYKATNSTEDGTKVADFFDEFLAEVKKLAKVNKFFHQTIYHCLYEFFYDPLQDNSDDEFPNEESSEDEDDTMEDERHSVDEKEDGTSPKPLKDFAVQVNPPKKRKKKKKKKARQNLLNNVKNKRKKVDNRLKVLEQIQREKAEREARLPQRHKFEEKQSGREFEKLKNKTDRQRLAFAVKKVFNIKLSWDELITTGPIPTTCFDDDSLRLIKDYKGYLPFEPIFRLLPDILAKGFKLVELSKIWYNSARRLGGSEPAVYQTVQKRFALIETEDKKVEEMRRAIRSLKDERASRQTERKLLVNQILRFDEIKEKYERCVEREKELKDYYKQLKEERNSEYPKLDALSRDDLQYKETYDQIQYLAECMKSVYRELQTASYELELVKQDYTVCMFNRTNLIPMQNDVRAAIQDIDVSLPINRERTAKSCHQCDKLRANIARMWVALYKVGADQLLNERADILLQSKYSDQVPINNLRNTVATGSHTSLSSEDEAAQLEEALDNALSHEMDHNATLNRDNTDNSVIGKSPPPPLPPMSKAEPELNVKEKSVFNSEYRPSTAGILDKHEAKEYRQRVDRLKKKFELDLSDLRTTVDCHVDVPVVESVPEQKNVQSGVMVASGDEADMESDQEEEKSNRPQSKKLVKRNGDRYSPLSDASDEYLYQQQVKKQPTGNPTKTIYILKQSGPKEPPQNRYILKTVPGAKLLPEKTMYQQQKASDNARQLRPHERQWGNDYKTLRALDNKYVNTLSMNKKSPFTGNTHAFSDTPVLPLEHHEGIFTPNIALSDGDISIDSGTGNSLDSDEDNEKAKKSNKITAKYKHKPRASVRKQLASTKISQASTDLKPAQQKLSRLPRLQNNKPAPPRLPVNSKLLAVESPPLSKSSPESLESRPIVAKKPAARNTLHMKKKVQPPPAATHKQQKLANEAHPLAPTHRVTVKKGVERKLPLGKIPKSIAQPKIMPRKQYGRIIDSPSDDDIDEIFKQSTSQRTLPPKPSVRVELQPQRAKRRYGIQHSLAKVR